MPKPQGRGQRRSALKMGRMNSGKITSQSVAFDTNGSSGKVQLVPDGQYPRCYHIQRGMREE